MHTIFCYSDILPEFFPSLQCKLENLQSIELSSHCCSNNSNTYVTSSLHTTATKIFAASTFPIPIITIKDCISELHFLVAPLCCCLSFLINTVLQYMHMQGQSFTSFAALVCVHIYIFTYIRISIAKHIAPYKDLWGRIIHANVQMQGRGCICSSCLAALP